MWNIKPKKSVEIFFFQPHKDILLGAGTDLGLGAQGPKLKGALN